MTSPATTRGPIPLFLGLSAAISLFLIWLIYLKTPSPTEAGWIAILPAANAFFNTLCAVCLSTGWFFIRRGNRTAHIRFMLTAVGLSVLFLVSYVTYHHFHGDTPFILISHIILSVVILPMIMSTLYYAARGQFDRHRNIARYTLPLWLYVAITGVIVFFFLKAYT